ncbi:MAG: hypothetical protein ACRD63_12115, partial [Pyrinomonadaceae bacterium]
MQRLKLYCAGLLFLVVGSISALAQDANNQANQFQPPAPKGSGVIVLRGARLIDGTGRPSISDGVVVVT